MSMWLSDTQSILELSSALAVGMRVLFELRRMVSLGGLTFHPLLVGGFFLIGGVMLFFDRAMLAMGNILFLIGLTIIIGPQKTLLFFARKQKARGTAAFFLGLILILMRWTFIGFLVEAYGIVVLFGDFLGTIAGFARGLPVVGPYIGMLVDRVGLGRRNAELPV
ncbi:hypothetical protein ACJ41O_008118 [Fusarium nematophilum]